MLVTQNGKLKLLLIWAEIFGASEVYLTIVTNLIVLARPEVLHKRITVYNFLLHIIFTIKYLAPTKKQS